MVEEITIPVEELDSDLLTEHGQQTVTEAVELLEDYYTEIGKGILYNGTIPDPNNSEHRKDCYFDDEEESVLFDAWQMLRYCNVSDSIMKPFTTAIEADTIFTEEELENAYQNVVKGDME